MGNTQSTVPYEGEGHPPLYYKGLKEAEQGSYNISEICFAQALSNHPGRSFWTQLFAATPRKANKDAGTDETPAEREFTSPLTDAGFETCDAVGGGKEVVGEPLDGPFAEGHSIRASTSTSDQPSPVDDKVTDVYMPLDENLHGIREYYRLLVDISFNYLRLSLTSPFPEKVMGLAGRYCILAISHTHLLLQSLMLWKEARFGDGLGLVDYEKKRNLQFGTIDTAAGAFGAEREKNEESSGTRGMQKWRMTNRSASQLLTLALLESELRYYHSSCLINYCVLLSRAAATATDTRYSYRVLANAQEHMGAVFSGAWQLAKEYPDQYIASIITKHVLRMDGGERDLQSSLGTGSHASQPFSLSLSKDQHRYLYASGAPWTPLQSGLIPLIAVRRVRLVIQEDCSRSTQAQLRSPEQRLSFHYINWDYPTELTVVPGCCISLLDHSIPGFMPGPHTLELQAVTARSCAAARTAVKSGSDESSRSVATAEEVQMSDAAPRQLTKREAPAVKKRDAALRKLEEDLRRKQRTIKKDLSFMGERTCVVLCLEEASLITLMAMYLSGMLHKLAGDITTAKSFVSRLKAMAVDLHTHDSVVFILISVSVRLEFGM